MECMLSTSDNPFNPFDDYAAWNTWDVAAGYHTAQFLGRIVHTSDDLSDFDQERIIEEAVDECVRENVLGVFIKVVRESTTNAA
jgi:hypothetical protein